MKTHKAVILGATGLVGGEVLQQLLQRDSYSEVLSLVRRPGGVSHPKLEERICDFENIDAHAESFDGADVFCCLGTTIRKAGSRDSFRRVDYVYPLRAARLARERGARKFLLVTALGSDPGSRVFYNRVKGELEEAMKEIGLPEVHIFRPSLLTGVRKEQRPVEHLGIFLAVALEPLMRGKLRRYRPTPSYILASAMLHAATGEESPGIHVHENDEILREGC